VKHRSVELSGACLARFQLRLCCGVVRDVLVNSYPSLPRTGGLEGMELRSEPRSDDSLVVTINGIDQGGESFKQNVVATRISNSGALLSGLTRLMRSGDVLWVEHKGKKSRFKIVWVRNSQTAQLIQAAIHLMKSEHCPWANM